MTECRQMLRLKTLFCFLRPINQDKKLGVHHVLRNTANTAEKAKPERRI